MNKESEESLKIISNHIDYKLKKTTDYSVTCT